MNFIFEKKMANILKKTNKKKSKSNSADLYVELH